MTATPKAEVKRRAGWWGNASPTTVDWNTAVDFTSWSAPMVPHTHSPLEIKVALHYWVSPENYSGPEVVYDICARMVVNSLLVVCGIDYKAGPALKAYVDALCNVPWPVQTWVIPKEGTDV